MRLTDFDFPLPQERIALRPAEPRDSARLLELTAQGLTDWTVRDLVQRLRPGDRLVFNDTRVLPARLKGIRAREGSEAAVEATLIRRLDAARWSAFVRPGKRLKPGDTIAFGPDLKAEVASRGEGGNCGHHPCTYADVC